MRFCVIGAGLAGLSTAFHLARLPGASVTVLEANAHLGGRANVTPLGEHCARLFLDDYHELFSILRAIPGVGGGSIYDALRPIHRFCHTESKGWVETSHLYPILAKELNLRERVSALLAVRPSPLLAEQVFSPSENRLGRRQNYSLRSQFKLAVSMFRSRTALALEGRTDQHLILPWVRHLEGQRVRVRSDSPVLALRPDGEGVTVELHDCCERYDAVVITAFASDLADLLSRSNIKHRMKLVEYTHVCVFTIVLNPREPVLGDRDPGLYSRLGVTVELQPRESRAIAVCTKPRSTHPDYVIPLVREMLDLRHELVSVAVRTNQSLNEAIFLAEYLDMEKLLDRVPDHVFFAGSCQRNSYPGDSGEGAARTARTVVDRITARYRRGAP